MDTEVPYITRLRHARPLRHEVRNIVIGIAGKLARAGVPAERIRLRTKQPISIHRVEARHLEIEVEIRRHRSARVHATSSDTPANFWRKRGSFAALLPTLNLAP
jgi:hypothetical protein